MPTFERTLVVNFNQFLRTNSGNAQEITTQDGAQPLRWAPPANHFNNQWWNELGLIPRCSAGATNSTNAPLPPAFWWYKTPVLLSPRMFFANNAISTNLAKYQMDWKTQNRFTLAVNENLEWTINWSKVEFQGDRRSEPRPKMPVAPQKVFWNTAAGDSLGYTEDFFPYDIGRMAPGYNKRGFVYMEKFVEGFTDNVLYLSSIGEENGNYQLGGPEFALDETQSQWALWRDNALNTVADYKPCLYMAKSWNRVDGFVTPSNDTHQYTRECLKRRSKTYPHSYTGLTGTAECIQYGMPVSTYPNFANACNANFLTYAGTANGNPVANVPTGYEFDFCRAMFATKCCTKGLWCKTGQGSQLAFTDTSAPFGGPAMAYSGSTVPATATETYTTNASVTGQQPFWSLSVPVCGLMWSLDRLMASTAALSQSQVLDKIPLTWMAPKLRLSMSISFRRPRILWNWGQVPQDPNNPVEPPGEELQVRIRPATTEEPEHTPDPLLEPTPFYEPKRAKMMDEGTQTASAASTMRARSASHAERSEAPGPERSEGPKN